MNTCFARMRLGLLLFLCLLSNQPLFADHYDHEPFVFLGPNDPIPERRFIYAVLVLPRHMLPNDGNFVIPAPLDDELPPINQVPQLLLGYPTAVPSQQEFTDQIHRRTTTIFSGHTTTFANYMNWSPNQLINKLVTNQLAFGTGRMVGGGFMIIDGVVRWDPFNSAKSYGQLEDDIDPLVISGNLPKGNGHVTMNPLLPRKIETRFDQRLMEKFPGFIPRQYIREMMFAIAERTNMPISIERKKALSPFPLNPAKYSSIPSNYDEGINEMLIKGYGLMDIAGEINFRNRIDTLSTSKKRKFRRRLMPARLRAR